MESYFLLLSLFLLPLLVLLKFKFPWLQSKHRLPPGPWTLPVVGSIHHLLGRGLPHHALRRLSRQYGQLMFLQLGELKTVVVSSKEAAKEILKTHDQSFCSRPVNPISEFLTYGGKDFGLAPYGEYWREMRKICVSELLSSSRVQSFRNIREDEVKSMIQQIQLLSSTGQSINLRDRLFTLTNEVTLRAIMGSKTKDTEFYLREIKKCGELITGIATLFPSSRLLRMLTGAARHAAKYRRNLDRVFENILKERRRKYKANNDVENLLGVLLRLHNQDSENGVLSIESIKAVIFDVLTGGTETSASTLQWAMAELMKNPRVMKKVQTELRQRLEGHDNVTESDLGELHYLRLIVKETLRLHPPVPLLMPRECRETCNILGYDIPKGVMVIVNAWALGRDPNYWKEAEEFKPERFTETNSDGHINGGDFEYIPFGGGRRMCPGIPYSSILTELVLANLLYHFNWELPNGMAPDELDMTDTFGVTAMRKYPLCLCAYAYKCN